MAGSKSFVFHFGDVEVREGEFSLIRAGEALPVQPKIFCVLLFLLHNPQRLITKEELLNAAWGDTTVTESSLTRIIALLRRLLGDDLGEPRYIATVPKIGYRFVCPVEVFEDGPDGATATGPTIPANGLVSETHRAAQHAEAIRTFLRHWLPSAAALASCLAAIGWYLLHRPLPPPHISEYRQLTHDGRQKWPVGTDGSRVYFTDLTARHISQVSVSGGEIASVPVALSDISNLESVSPDGSILIVDTEEKGILFDRPRWNVSVLRGSLRRLPDGAGATFSPDGQKVVYAGIDGGIWLVRRDGAGVHELATVDGAVGGFAWSPDGATIRFGKENRLWEISSDGSNLHPLLAGRLPPGGQCCGRWTADGKLFLFRSGDLGSGDTGIWVLDERRGLFRQPQAEPVQLTAGPVRWSNIVPGKDASKIYAVGSTLRGQLSRYDPQTKHFLPFLGGISAGCVAFSRDGQFLSYVLYPEGTLWKANRDGSNRVRLSDTPISAFHPRWSPDGKQIVFTDLANVTSLIVNNCLSELYMVTAEGGNPQRLLPSDNGTEGDPTWSPDGRRIAYGWSASGQFGATAEIRIVDLASRQVTQVRGSVGMTSPRWSPDGRFIAALSSGALGLRVFDCQSQRWSVLVEKRHVAYPEWSRDSRSIYFEFGADDPGVFRIPASGGKPERVADLKDFPLAGWWGWMGLDPTDAPMMLRDVGSDDIYAVSLEQK